MNQKEKRSRDKFPSEENTYVPFMESKIDEQNRQAQEDSIFDLTKINHTFYIRRTIYRVFVYIVVYTENVLHRISFHFIQSSV